MELHNALMQQTKEKKRRNQDEVQKYLDQENREER